MSSAAALKAWETRRAKAAASAAPTSVAPSRPRRALVERVSPLAVASSPVELSAGLKAAETRRALAQERADAEARRIGVSTPSPLAEAAMVELWIDDAKLGCGYRYFVVVEIGPREVKLFSASSLSPFTVDRLTFDRHAKPYRSKAARVAAIVERNIATSERLNVEYDARAAKAAQAVLQ